MPYGTTPDIGFRNLRNIYRRLGPGGHSLPLQYILESKSIDYRSQHPGIIGSDPVYSLRFRLSPPPDVAPANNDGNTHSHCLHLLNLPGNFG